MLYNKKIKWLVLSFFCIAILFIGFFKINIECSKRNQEVMKNIKLSEKFKEEFNVGEEYKYIYSVQDNAPVKIFFSKDPFDLKIDVNEYEMVINKDVFLKARDTVSNNIKSIKIKK